MIVHYTNSAIVLLIIALNKWGGTTFENLLYLSSRENGPYEQVTALLLFCLGIVCLYQLKSRPIVLNIWEKRALISLGVLSFIGGAEEISWGQQWLNFETNSFFEAYNQQNETNLHNLIPATVFSTIINVVIYTLFIYAPLLHLSFPNTRFHRLINRSPFKNFVPSTNVVSILLFAGLLHAWFIPATYSDSVALVAGIILFLFQLALYTRRKKSVTKYQIWSLLFLIGACALCIAASSIFSHENMQYEIREFITVFGLLYWVLEWTKKAGIPKTD